MIIVIPNNAHPGGEISFWRQKSKAPLRLSHVESVKYVYSENQLYLCKSLTWLRLELIRSGAKTQKYLTHGQTAQQHR